MVLQKMKEIAEAYLGREVKNAVRGWGTPPSIMVPAGRECSV
jgi:hypothetical protein